eukprot:5111801-Alexandrium_andersonii.AAC.1
MERRLSGRRAGASAWALVMERGPPEMHGGAGAANAYPRARRPTARWPTAAEMTRLQGHRH